MIPKPTAKLAAFTESPLHPAGRRAFVSQAIASALLGPRLLLAPGIWSASVAFGETATPAQAPTSIISQALAANVLKSVGGVVGDQLEAFAVGDALAAIGLGGQDDVAAKLDQISAQLEALQTSVNALSTSMNEQLTAAKYDTVVLTVQDMVVANKLMMGDYEAMAKAKTVAELKGKQADFRDRLQNYDLEGHMEKWDSSLRGLLGTNGLIVSWNKAVYASNHFFGPAASASIRSHWHHFDTEQSRTVMFFVEKLNDQDKKSKVPVVLERWRQNRRKQIALLRGMSPGSDDFAYFDPQTRQVAHEVLPVKFLPDDVGVNVNTGIVYGLKIIPEFYRTDTGGEFDSKAAALLRSLHYEPDWSLCGEDDFNSLFALIGGSSSPGRFYSIMKDKGFRWPPPPTHWPPGNTHVWTTTSRQSGSYKVYKDDRLMIIEGEPARWSAHSDELAMLVVRRSLRPNESANYYYAGA